MRLRRSALAALLTAGILVPAVSVAASAFAAQAPAGHAVVGFKSTPKPVKTSKPARPVPFSASGTVTAVDAAAGTVTLVAKGGTKDVRKRTVTVSVAPDARIVVNEVRSGLAAVATGQRIAVVGTRAGSVYTASRLRAKGVRATPAPSPTVEPTEAPETPEPTETPEPVETHGDE